MTAPTWPRATATFEHLISALKWAEFLHDHMTDSRNAYRRRYGRARLVAIIEFVIILFLLAVDLRASTGAVSTAPDFSAGFTSGWAIVGAVCFAIGFHLAGIGRKG